MPELLWGHEDRLGTQPSGRGQALPFFLLGFCISRVRTSGSQREMCPLLQKRARTTLPALSPAT